MPAADYGGASVPPEQEAANTERSRARVRVEQVFGHIETAMNGCYVRTIGIARAQTKIGLANMAYNISFRATFGTSGTVARHSPKFQHASTRCPQVWI